jgi:hypothetical protein
MIDTYRKTEEMTASEKILAVNNIKTDLENNFVVLGQLLSDIKKAKLFRYKGYKNFTEFVENEFNLSGSFAGKVIGAYDLFIKKLDVDEASVKNIGLDKLTMIKPVLKDLNQVETENWIRKAEDVSATELREEIREIKQKKKDKTKTIKEVLVDQYLETMVTFFNCSRKELNFKLALFFQDEDLEKVSDIIIEKQRKFQESNQL